MQIMHIGFGLSQGTRWSLNGLNGLVANSFSVCVCVCVCVCVAGWLAACLSVCLYVHVYKRFILSFSQRRDIKK